ncbi:ATP-binding protein [Cytobacillus sp. FJAT-54145]|uniref:histidine kinase n=1 Tax=Cytobacillus spartinae TaxID=3299023 RepID=A0ABW6KIK6_9BACI
MSLEIVDLLVNLLFILLFVSVYQMYIIKKRDEYKINFPLITILSSISIILCMTFPIRLSSEFIFDLRYVPLVVSIFYGNTFVGLILGTVIIIYRYFLGGVGFYITLMLVPIIVTLTLVIKTYYKKFDLKLQSYWVLGFISILYSIIVIYLSEVFGQTDILTLTMSIKYIVINFLSVLLISYLIEMLRKFVLLGAKLRAAELAQMEKMNLVSALAASISHEVRNPLTVTRGFLQLLQSPDLHKDQRIEYYELAISELDRAQDVITDYLTFAKSDSTEFTVLDVKSELEKVVSIIEPLANMSSIKIEQTLQDECFTIGSKQIFRQALINICKNSIEAMPDGGNLSIQLAVIHERVSLTISDNGQGMSQDQLIQIGKPYFSTKEKGTGLGIMVVKNVVKEMNGEILVNSELRKGTTFTLLFPPVK